MNKDIDLTIDRLTKSNLSSFYDLFTYTVRNDFDDYSEKLQDYFLNYQYTADNFAIWIKKPIKVTFVAVDEDENVAGFIVGKKIYGGVGFIEWLGVKRSARGNGIGTKLIQHYESFTKENHGHRVELFTKNSSVYEKSGYSVLAHRKNGYFGLDRYHLQNQFGKWQNVIPDKEPSALRSLLKKIRTFGV